MEIRTWCKFPESKPRKIKGKTMTKQSHRDECDVNQILAKFQKTGALTHVNENRPQYGDYDGTDFKTAMDLITGAQAMFGQLPSAVRSFFANDPSRFLDYVNDPQNTEDVRSGFASITEDREHSASPTGESAPGGSLDDSAAGTPSSASEPHSPS